MGTSILRLREYSLLLLLNYLKWKYVFRYFSHGLVIIKERKKSRACGFFLPNLWAMDRG
jgi:hypothetical protein